MCDEALTKWPVQLQGFWKYIYCICFACIQKALKRCGAKLLFAIKCKSLQFYSGTFETLQMS